MMDEYKNFEESVYLSLKEAFGGRVIELVRRDIYGDVLIEVNDNLEIIIEVKYKKQGLATSDLLGLVSASNAMKWEMLDKRRHLLIVCNKVSESIIYAAKDFDIDILVYESSERLIHDVKGIIGRYLEQNDNTKKTKGPYVKGILIASIFQSRFFKEDIIDHLNAYGIEVITRYESGAGNYLRFFKQNLNQYDFGIVDLTDENPNILLEAGIAIGRGLPIIFVIQKGHQSTLYSEYPIIEYDTYHKNSEIISNNLVDKIRNLLNKR